MGQMKNTKIVKILIIVVSVLILILSGVAYLYFATDIFKTNKQLFFKYIGQVVDSKNGFIDNKIVEYFDKKGSTPYSNSGQFLVDIQTENSEQYEAVNNFNISFTGQMDNQNKKQEQKISLNYSDNVTFPFIFRKVGDNIALQSDSVSKNFIAFNISEKDGQIISIEDMVNKISTSAESVKSAYEDGEVNEYIRTITDKLNEEKFSKLEENGLKGYKLTITTTDAMNIFKDISENENATDSENENDSQEGLDGNNEQNIEITVYSKGGKLNKIIIAFGTANLTIAKEQEKGLKGINASLNIPIGDQGIDISLKGTYSGIDKMANVEEKYELSLQMADYSTIYTLNNNVNFAQNVNIEDLTEQNTTFLNKYPDDKVEEFLESVSERVEQVYKDQMQELGLQENQYPLSNLFPILNMLGLQSDNDSKKNEIYEAISMISNDALSEAYNEYYVDGASGRSMEQVYLEKLNAKLLENVDILSSLGITYNGNELSQDNPIGQLPATLETEGYTIEITQDQKINVDSKSELPWLKNSKQLDKTQIEQFNAEYEIYVDTNLPGVTTKGLLSIIDSNNEEDKYDYKIKEINFNGNEYEATKENIAFIKEDIETGSAYKVEFEKDPDTGAIYRAVINPK